MARCYALAARKSEASYPRSQTVALIVVATENRFTLVFLERFPCLYMSKGTRAMERIVSRCWCRTTFSGGENGGRCRGHRVDCGLSFPYS